VLYWNGHRVMGVLAMSRAIGDHGLRPYVIPVPEVGGASWALAVKPGYLLPTCAHTSVARLGASMCTNLMAGTCTTTSHANAAHIVRHVRYSYALCSYCCGHSQHLPPWGQQASAHICGVSCQGLSGGLSSEA
jgi:hypothetical protein